MRLSSRPDVLRLKAKHDVSGLIKALRYKADPNIQQAASDALIAIGEPAIPELIAALASPNESGSVKRVLRDVGVLAIDPLISVIKVDQRKRVRKSAVEVLVDIGMFSIEPLVSTLVHRDPEVRDTVIKALLMIGSLAVEPLIAQLNDINQPKYVRLDAIRALSKLGGSQVTAALLAVARNDPSVEVKKMAANALGRQVAQVESVKLDTPPLPVNQPRGLSLRFKKQAKVPDVISKKNRWLRLQQALPDLKPVSLEVFQQLIRTFAVYRQYKQTVSLVEDLEKEFSQYSRIKADTYSTVSIRMEFDNELSQKDRVLPATRQLEVIIVVQDNQFYMFTNAKYIEQYW